MHETSEIIDLNKLKVKEKIFFYEEVILYEDELADNGVATLSVKIVSTFYLSFTLNSRTVE